MSFEKYVDFVQGLDDAKQKNNENYAKYRKGEIVVVDQRGGVHQLSYSNTGDGFKEGEEHLKGIDRKPLPTVRAAESAMKQLQVHRQEEWKFNGEQEQLKREQEWREKLWPVNPAQPEKKSYTEFEKAATAAARDKRTDKVGGEAEKVWRAWHESGGTMKLDDVPAAPPQSKPKRPATPSSDEVDENF